MAHIRSKSRWQVTMCALSKVLESSAGSECCQTVQKLHPQLCQTVRARVATTAQSSCGCPRHACVFVVLEDYEHAKQVLLRPESHTDESKIHLYVTSLAVQHPTNCRSGCRHEGTARCATCRMKPLTCGGRPAASSSAARQRALAVGASTRLGSLTRATAAGAACKM